MKRIGKMKSHFALASILLPLGMALTANSQDLKYTHTALTPVSFASFDTAYLGDGHHFTPERLSPKDLSGEMDRFKQTLQTGFSNCGFFSCIAMDLIEALLPKGMSRNDVLERLDASHLSSFTQGAWGLAVANADNDPNGQDNLFVLVDDIGFKLNVLDFLHPDKVTPSSKAREVLSLLKIDFGKLKLPTITSTGFNDKLLEMDEGLSNPRGICTNRRGDFWVADMGKNRVVHYRYDTVKHRMIYVGSLSHLSHPMDVSFSPASGGFNELLGIANTNGNSAIFVSPVIVGETDYRRLPDYQKGEISNLNGATLARPTAIAADLFNPERIYLAYSGRSVIRLERTGAYEFKYVKGARWPIDGEISSLKCDRDGNLFVTDAQSSFIGKYTPGLDFIFSTGGQSDGSDVVTRGTKTGFNHPKYIAIGSQDDLYVSERWAGFSGVQRFFNWPRLVDNTVSFQLDCQVSAPIQDRTVKFMFNVTKKANMEIHLYRVPDAGDHVEIWHDTLNDMPAGPSTLAVPVAQIGSGFGSNGTYRAEFIVHETGLGNVSDRTSYWINIGDPEILGGTAAIASAYFNPDLFPATAVFNVSREAKVTFKMAPKDAVGDGNTLPFIPLGKAIIVPRLETGVHTVPLNIASADLSKVREGDAMELWIEMESLPCGTKVLAKFPVPTGTYLYLDRTAPTGGFAPFSAKGFNPTSPGFSGMSFSFTSDDHSPNRMTIDFQVYKAGDLAKPVRRLFYNATYLGGEPPFSYSWDGKDDDGKTSASGDYVFSAFVKDLAGNSSRINSPTFVLDTEAPILSFSLPGSGLEFQAFKDKQALLLKSNPVSLGLQVQERLPKDIVIRLERINPQDASVVSTFNYGTILHNGTAWPSTFKLDPATFPGDGVYGLSVYGTDQVGNTSESNPLRSMASPQIGDVRYIMVDHFAPLLTVKLSKSVIRSGGQTDLILSAYHQGGDKAFDFSYTVALYYGTTKLTDFASGNLTIANSTVVLPFNHALYLTKKGRFTFKVHLTANIGRVGNSQDQNADLYVDAFPPQVAGTDGMSVPKKFFLTGQVGDPNLVNDLNKSGFENYSVYWKEGAITALPLDLSTWKKTGISVPLHAIDRTGPNASSFPFANTGDNQEAITSAFGSATLAYLDGGATGANFTSGAVYTVLVVVKEKGKPLELSSANAVLRNFRVENPSSLKLSDVRMNGTSSGPIAYDAATGSFLVSGTITGGDAQNAVVRLYLYGKNADVDGDGIAEPLATRLEKNDVMPGSDFSFPWDGKDGKGSFVKDGLYRAQVVVEQTPTGRSEGPFDMRVLEDRDINVVTPLRLVEGILSPTTISSAPASSGLPGNTATFKYKATKASYAYLEILDATGNKVFDIGPEANLDGAGVFHTLGWNATDPGTGLPVAEGKYRIRPYVVANIGGASKAYYSIPVSPLGYYEVTVTAPQAETPELGRFTTLPIRFGNSDAIWSSRPNGQLWKMDPVVLNTPVTIKLTGTQTLNRYQPAHFSGTYSRNQEAITFKVKSRIGISRNKRFIGYTCDYWNACDNRVGDQDWVYTTTSSNLITKSIPTGAAQNFFHTSPDIYFDSPLWEGIVPGSTCVNGGAPGVGCGNYNAQQVMASNVVWSAIYSKDDEILDILYQNGSVPGTDLPTDIMTPTPARPPYVNADLPTDHGNTFVRTGTYYTVSDPTNLLRESAALQSATVAPGSPQTFQIAGRTLTRGLSKIVDATYWQMKAFVTLPPGGSVSVTRPYAMSRTNDISGVDQTVELNFSGHVDEVPLVDRLEMPLTYTYSMASSGGQTVAVPGVEFPFPPQTGCGTHYFRDAGGVDNVDIWSPSQAWVKDGSGKPVGYHTNSGCDYVANLPLSMTLQPGAVQVVPLAGLVPAGISITSFLFGDNGSESSLRVNGVELRLKIVGSNLEISYPVGGSQATRIDWNTTTAVPYADPILAANDNSVQGYMRVSPHSEAFCPADLLLQPGFPDPDFTPVGKTQSLFSAYAATAEARSLPIPDAAATQGEAWKLNQPSWKYLLWNDGAGTPGFHWDLPAPKGLDFTSWSPLTFRYIDGRPNQDYDIFADNRSAGTFTPEVRALATPRRILPVSFLMDLDGIKVGSLAACPIGVSNGTWEPIALLSAQEVLNSGISKTLGFWDVTNKAGGYYLRLLAKDASGNSFQVTGTVKIGTDVSDNLQFDQIVSSPLKQASLIFPPNSKYSGMVAVDPTNPKNLPGFQFGNVPKGLVVDVTPSGLVFDEANVDNRPQLAFHLRTKDILAMGGRLNGLGEIGVYYLNDKSRALENAQFAPSVYNMDDPSHPLSIVDNPTLADNQILELKGHLNHTSLYGSFSLSSFVTINPVVSPLTAAKIVLSGKGSPDLATGAVHLYVSDKPAWDAAATFVGATSVTGTGDWSWADFPLPNEGKNYIYACIGQAVVSSNEPTNGIIVVKDGAKPKVETVSWDPQIVGAQAKAAQLTVKLSEPGDVTLFIPSVFGNSFTSRTRADDATVVFSVPMTNLQGAVLDEGEYPAFLTASDLVGNLADVTNRTTLAIDRTAPILQVDPPLYAGRITGTLKDNYKLGEIRVLDQNAKIVKTAVVNGVSASWKIALSPSDFPSQNGKIRILGFDLAGNASQEVQFPMDKIFPKTTDTSFVVMMKDNHFGLRDGSQPEVTVANHSAAAISGFTLRLWLSREEAPYKQIAVDPYFSNPCGIRLKIGVHPDNQNLVTLDVLYPASYSLKPGMTTPVQGLGFGLHYLNAPAYNWNVSNDWSWQGISSLFSLAKNVTLYDRNGNLLSGAEPPVSSIPQPPAPPAPDTRSRVTQNLQVLYLFGEGFGRVVSDLSGVGIPMDMALSGNVEWIHTGGLKFPSADHNALLANKTPNPKLYESARSANKLTLEAWVRPGNLTQTSARIMEYGASDGALERNWEMLQLGKNLEFRLRTASAATVYLTTTNNPIAVSGQDYHIAMTYEPFNSATSSGGMRIYVNGTLAASNQESQSLGGTGTNAWNPAYGLFLGNLPVTLDKDWQGTLSLAAVYSKALSPAEIVLNVNAGILEPMVPVSLFAGVTCEERMIPSDIVDGQNIWVEDKGGDGSPIKMNGVSYARGIGGKAGASGGTSFLIYDLTSEGNRMGLQGSVQKLTGFTGLQTGGTNANTLIKVSRAGRKPSDQDWLNNTGSVLPLFTSNNGANLPINLDIGGSHWLFLGQQSVGSSANPLGDFAELRAHYSNSQSGGATPDFVNGIQYKYFEGVWDWLPDFRTMVPMQQGLITSFPGSMLKCST